YCPERSATRRPTGHGRWRTASMEPKTSRRTHVSSDDKKGLFTDGTEATARVTAVPLSDVDTHARGEASIGTLVQSASAQVSALVRSEVELAKAEIAGEAKKVGVGAGFFAVAGVVALYSSF